MPPVHGFGLCWWLAVSLVGWGVAFIWILVLLGLLRGV